jgi:hypothetical protein
VYELARIAVPTLLLIGQRDITAIGKERAPPEVARELGNYPELGRQAHARIPGSVLVAFADTSDMRRRSRIPSGLTASSSPISTCSSNSRQFASHTGARRRGVATWPRDRGQRNATTADGRMRRAFGNCGASPGVHTHRPIAARRECPCRQRALLSPSPSD